MKTHQSTLRGVFRRQAQYTGVSMLDLAAGGESKQFWLCVLFAFFNQARILRRYVVCECASSRVPLASCVLVCCMSLRVDACVPVVLCALCSVSQRVGETGAPTTTLR